MGKFGKTSIDITIKTELFESSDSQPCRHPKSDDISFSKPNQANF